MEEDWPLIEASFLKQYGIRLRAINDMPYDEFCSYLIGIMPDTPLGNIVRIRSETDKDIIANFTDDQRKIRNEWLGKLAKNKTKDDTQAFLNSILQSFKELAGEGG
jgi:hypothetical protein